MTSDEMSPQDDGAALEEISREDCLELVASQVIGRVAVADFGAPPLVVPVNFLLDGESVVFRTDYGTKFRLAVMSERVVSFEVDALDPGRRSGWSVLIQGSASEVDESEHERLELDTWAPGRKSHWVRIVADTVTGRRIRLTPSANADQPGYL